MKRVPKQRSLGNKSFEEEFCITQPHNTNTTHRKAINFLVSEYETNVQDVISDTGEWMIYILLMFLEWVKMEIKYMIYYEKNSDIFLKNSVVYKGKERKTNLFRVKRQIENGNGEGNLNGPGEENVKGNGEGNVNGNGNGNGNINSTNGLNETQGNNTETSFCMMPVIGFNTSMNICVIIVPLLPVIAIGIVNAVFTVLSPSLITQPNFPPPSSSATPGQSLSQPTIQSQQQLTASQSSLTIDVKVRSLVPFCTPSGYLSLVQRLRGLIAGNTGRPLNPIAASLATGVNFCQVSFFLDKSTNFFTHINFASRLLQVSTLNPQ